MGNGPALTTRTIDEPRIDEPRIDEPRIDEPGIDEPRTVDLLGPTVAELSTVLVELTSLVPLVETEAGQRLRRAMARLNQVVVAYC